VRGGERACRACRLLPARERPEGVPDRYVVAIGVQSQERLDITADDRTQGSMALVNGLFEAPSSHLHFLSPRFGEP
jgi:hypothetical protein